MTKRGPDRVLPRQTTIFLTIVCNYRATSCFCSPFTAFSLQIPRVVTAHRHIRCRDTFGGP